MSMKTVQIPAAALLLIFAISAWGQSQKAAQQSPSPSPTPAARAATPQAKPGDVDTLDHILAAVYDSISGPAGPRDWDRFRSLFYPGAHLIPTFADPKTQKPGARFLTPDEYAQRGQAFFDKEGFFEVSIANRIEQWDRIAHVWSTYESRHAKGDAKPFQRGINSFQFFNDGTRWWVVNIYWEGETPEHQIPEKYLK